MYEPHSDWQVRTSTNIIMHTSYNNVTFDYDFALIKLDSPVDLGDCAGTVCLPTGGDVEPGSTCWITGWGHLRTGGDSPNIMQEGSVKIIKNSECGLYASNSITDRMICAQGVSSDGGIVDACQGDSGGPLVCETGGVWSIYGVTSWGNDCAGVDYPGLWSRVVNQLDWVESMMANPPNPPPPGPLCPMFSFGPDSDGDCGCLSGKCSTDGGVSFLCPTSGRPGGFGGTYFLPSCEDCQCVSVPTPAPTPVAPTPAPTPAPACPKFSTGPDWDGDCYCRSGRCSTDGGVSYLCPTSGGPGGFGGYYFLPSCDDCQCG